jgi:hypothetical protein
VSDELTLTEAGLRAVIERAVSDENELSIVLQRMIALAELLSAGERSLGPYR